MKKYVKRWCAAGFSAILLLFAAVVPVYASSNKSVSEARSGTVRVISFYDCVTPPFNGELVQLELISTGTGFGVGSKAGKETSYFVTNRHVVQSVQKYRVEAQDGDIELEYRLKSVYLLLSDDAYTDAMGLDMSRSVPCDVIYEAAEDAADIAVLRANEAVPGRVALPFRNASELDAAEEVFAIGYPGAADRFSIDELSNQKLSASIESATITNGLFSRVTFFKAGKCDVIQHSAVLNHGNSGGPLIDRNGAVVGVNTWGWEDSGYYASVTAEEVMKVLDGLRVDYCMTRQSSSVPFVLVGVIVLLLVVAVVLLFVKNPGTASAENASGSASVAPAGPVISSAPIAGATSAGASAIPDDSGLRFQAVSGTFAGKRFAITPQVRIGRDPGRNDFVYPANTPGISGVHCVLLYHDGQLYLKDMGSTCGTFLGTGQRLAGQQAVILKPGDKFYLGTETETFIITRKGGVS